MPTEAKLREFIDEPHDTFGDDRVAVTQEAAGVLALLLKSLLDRGVDRTLAQHFLIQNLIALWFKSAPRFNGGVFASPARVKLKTAERDLLRKASAYDWSKVQPEIFGTLFQHSLDSGDRRSLGVHFTHPADIMKIVGPTIVRPWQERVEGAKTLTALNEARARLHDFRVLDPACGSGNFLYIAYRELTRIEARIIERSQQEFRSEARKAAQPRFGLLSAKNFFGIDLHPLALELAKVTMVVARKLANTELHFTEQSLPLDNLDSNFQAMDALVTPSGAPATWPPADVIIGNPPFTGAKWLKPQRGKNYVDTLRKAYPEVPGMADYCVYWFRKAHDHLAACTKMDAVVGRAGLVGTQNIRHNQSRVGGLDHVIASGTILDAVDNQPWSGDAAVNVSIVNWVKTQDPALLPKQRRLWFMAEPSPDVKPTAGFDLDYRDCAVINSSLTDTTDVSGAVALECNVTPQRVFQGVTPGHEGFVLKPAEQEALLAKDPSSAPVIFPYLVGRELVSGDGKPQRFLIDFGTRTVLEAQAFPEAFARVKARILSNRKEKAEKGKDAAGKMRPHHKQFLERWWRLSWDREDMKQAFMKLHGRYIAGSRTQRAPFIFCFVHQSILPGDKLQTFAFDDDYSFGILQGGPHLEWYAAKAARLKNEVDYNYSTESVFDTYPWPQAPTKKQIEAIASAAVKVRQARASASHVKGGLRGLYNSLALPGANPLKNAHRDLDDAIMDAYGFSKKKDLLSQLLDLNSEVAGEIEHEKPVLKPGIPASYPDASKLLTSDCISPELDDHGLRRAPSALRGC